MAKGRKIDCPRCGGSGNYRGYGVCFRCGGRGKVNPIPVRAQRSPHEGESPAEREARVRAAAGDDLYEAAQAYDWDA